MALVSFAGPFSALAGVDGHEQADESGLYRGAERRERHRKHDSSVQKLVIKDSTFLQIFCKN